MLLPFVCYALPCIPIGFSHAAEAGKPAALACLERHYGVRAILVDGAWQAELAPGQLVPFDDGIEKDAPQRIEQGDLQDMFAERYRRGPIRKVQRAEEDPGRVRVDAIFAFRYGKTRAAVEKSLVRVDFVGTSLRVHRRIASPLREVADRLRGLQKTVPDLRKYLVRLGGTFAWRSIAGTHRKSAHAYAIALDVNPKASRYWRWDARRPVRAAWHNEFPQELVDAFEQSGFIWGGRWYHYDTMHFEFRPELLDETCYATDPVAHTTHAPPPPAKQPPPALASPAPSPPPAEERAPPRQADDEDE